MATEEQGNSVRFKSLPHILFAHSPGAGAGGVGGGGGGAESLELVRDPQHANRDPHEIIEPFVEIPGGDVFSRSLLVRAAVGGGDGLPVSAVLKIQRDIPRLPPVRGFGRSYNNPHAERAFVEEARCRQKLADAGIKEGAGRGGAEGGEGGGLSPHPVEEDGGGRGRFAPENLPLCSPPITYCKKTHEFFYPPCPTCGGLLVDCRDEVVLGQVGLPAFAEGGRRFLFCANCPADDRTAKVFYTTAEGEPPRAGAGGGAEVRVGAELYRDLQLLVTEPRTDAAQSPVLQNFPCLSCQYRKACYPRRGGEPRPIPAEKMLYPVAYHEFYAVVHEFNELQYDEFTQLLGGRPWAELKPALEARVPQAAVAARLDLLDTQYTGGGRAGLFDNAGGSRDGLEAIWLKLAAFEQLCQGVERIYRCCRRPHLGLHPGSIGVAPGVVGPGAPALWAFNVEVDNPSTAIPVARDATPQDEEITAYLGPADAPRQFTSPIIRRPPFGHEEYANIKIRAVRRTETGVEIDVDLLSEVISAFKLNRDDRLKVTLNAPGKNYDALVLWVVGVESIPGGYRATGKAERVRPDVAEALTGTIEQTFWDCRLNICRSYSLDCDFYSLGMIFLCSLLVNDEHSLAEVGGAVEDVARTLVSTATEVEGSRQTEKKLQGLLVAGSMLFGSSTVLYQVGDRQDVEDRIPPPLWFACQKLGFGLLTGIPELLPGPAAGGDENSRIKNVVERLNHLNLWAEGRLFAVGASRQELAAISGH